MAGVSLCCPRMATGVHRILRNADRNIYRSRYFFIIIQAILIIGERGGGIKHHGKHKTY